ncbi:MAG: LysR family transcriptional regulator [Agathobacter sp.]
MNYNKLKYFYEIAKIQNLSRASELLYVSQSSLSKTIADLEKDFGTQLFVRTNRNLVLTEAGKELQRQLENFFSNEQTMYAKVRQAAIPAGAELSAKLNVGFMAFDHGLLVPDIIKKFNQTYPSIQIEAKRYNKKEMFKKLDNQTLDMIWAIFSMDELNDEVDYRILDEHHFSIIARDDHPMANRSSISITELQNDSFLAHGHRKNSNEYAYYFDWCNRCGIQPNIVAEYDYVESVMLMVQAGAGIAILSDAAPIHAFKNLVSIPLDNAPILYSGIFWRKDNGNKAIPLFAQFYWEALNNSNR